MKHSLTGIPAGLICLVVALVYWEGLLGGFIFDDFPNLVSDPDWKVTTLDPTQWQRAMSLGIASEMGRPLALLSFAINHYFTGLDPYWLKLTNLGFHALNSVLVFMLCRQLFAALPAGTRLAGTGPALAVALAWALHPLQVSSVLYVVQRMEVGAHIGVLLALIFYIRARSKQQEGQAAALWFALSLLAILFGLGFKESAALTPGYFLALELAIFRFRTNALRPSRWLVTAYAVVVAAALAAYLGWFLPRYLPPEAYAFRSYTLVERLISQIHALTMYLGQMLLPLPDRLPFYYDNFPFQHSLASTLAKLSLLVSLLVAALAGVRRWPLFSLGILWFFVAHALTSNVVPLELAFEHRNYFALLGMLLAIAQLLSVLLGQATKGTPSLISGVLLAFLSILTAIQAATWGEPLRLAHALAGRNPDSPRAGYDLGLQMLRAAGTDPRSPLLSLAEKELKHAAALPGASPLAEQALIFISGRRNEAAPQTVWQQFRDKLGRRAIGPQEGGALQGVVECRLAGNCSPLDDQQLLDTLLFAIERNPASAFVHMLYSDFTFYVLGEPELGIRMARECIRLDPDELAYKAALARKLALTDPSSRALTDLVEEIRLGDVHGRFSEEIEASFLPQNNGTR